MKFTRTFPLDDITIRSGGDGRTVEAYAAVFNSAVPISDSQGRYSEIIAPGAFNRTIAEKGVRFGVFYNHGLTLHGTPSDRGSMPIGTPLEVRADDKGLFTVTRYNKNPLADEALEAINSGAITGQSFAGRFINSDPQLPPGGFKAGADGALRTVTRTEIAMSEYGPTPFPAYSDAVIVGVRSCTCERGTTIELEINIDGGGEPPDPATQCDCACDCCASGDCTPDPSVPASSAPGRSSGTPDSPLWLPGRLRIRKNYQLLQSSERGLR